MASSMCYFSERLQDYAPVATIEKHGQRRENDIFLTSNTGYVEIL
jgi:hypothetical protein